MSILAVNAGSSSLKFALYPVQGQAVSEAEMTGCIEGLEPAGKPCITWSIRGQAKTIDAVQVGANVDPFDAALPALKQLLVTHFAHVPLQAIAHRVVHGGLLYSAAVRVTPEVLTQLATLNSLAPLHQPHNLAGVRAFSESFPDVVQVACFDTAFHRTLSALETTFAIDRQLTARGVRRFGFHGLSYQFVSQVLQDVSPRSAGRTVMAHLGNGASVCATTEHQSRATTMGFSALDGLMMGSRSGALDPGVLLYLMEQGWGHDAIQKLLYKQSGLLGVSGESADMRTLRASGSPSAQLAIDLFTHRVVREVGALTACVGGLDVLAFTGGIGEHDAVLRQQVCEALHYLGVSVDAARNQAATGDAVRAIHAEGSGVEVWVIPTDEGRVAAREALGLMRGA
ncbi:acetate/propionate family kinase [Limnohabitans sp. JirII-31]|uniref:acetate/propionate family kinase n=1 Tax=Limnohabitans sp. JirII-31 TaxID=1977908 RepID=UPI000C1F3A67|nr:acetate/propionate family kinase [Limnohabitans sp. JirII-31]PIT79872.1 acetate kinase [Limnohabitans sp. JirII-31]